MSEVDHRERAHALLGASSASRWINCPPSALMCEALAGNSTTEFADLGTQAHELAEKWLRLGYANGPGFDINDYPDEVSDAVQLYVEYVHDLFTQSKYKTPDTILLIEQKVDFSHLVPDGFGTVDAAIIADGTMHIIDYKHGEGVRVSAHDNPQLKLYALGALYINSVLYNIDNIVLHVVQPRMDNFSTFEITPLDLQLWGENEVVKAAELAHVGGGELNKGYWCQFCQARPRCKAHAEPIAEFEAVKDKLLTDNELAELYLKFDTVKSWINKAEAYMYEQATVNGVQFEGLKLVEGRAMRKWVDEQEVSKALLANGWTDSDIYNVKLQGITAIEKLVGKKAFPEIVGDLVHKPSGAPKLVPLADKRPAMGLESAREAFGNLEFDENI